MSADRAGGPDIEASVAALGDGPLTEDALATHVAPLFSRASSANRLTSRAFHFQDWQCNARRRSGSD